MRDFLTPTVFVLRKDGEDVQLVIGGGGEEPRTYKLTPYQLWNLCVESMKLVWGDVTRFAASQPPQS